MAHRAICLRSTFRSSSFVLTAAFLVAALSASLASAAPLPPGSGTLLTGAPDPFAGLTPVATTPPIHFVGVDARSNVHFSGTLTQDVFLNTTTGGVTGTSFRWNITSDSTSPDSMQGVSMVDFSSWTVDADFVVSSTGAAPASAVRADDGSTVTFNYRQGSGIPPGGATKTLFIQTNAPTFKLAGATNMIDGGVASVMTYQPADLCEPGAFEPPPSGSSSSRAYGLFANAPPLDALQPLVDALLMPNPGPFLIDPTPDTDQPAGAKSPFLSVPLSPLLLVNALTVTAHQTNNGTSVSSDATATTADVHVLDPGTGFVINANAVLATVACNADGGTAGSSYAGSMIEGLNIGGQNFDTITEPTTIKIVEPITKSTIEVHLLEKIESGAKAGETQPDPATHAFESDLAVNGIHAKITDPMGNIIADVIVAHAECKASFGPVCEEFPHVSGKGYVVGVNADETIIDPLNQLLNHAGGRVRLPSTGGSDDSTLKQIGPISGSGTTLVDSGTAFSHTEGTVDNAGNTASSETVSEVEKLKLIDTGASPTNPFLGADVVRAECTAQAGPPGAGSTTGKTTIAGVTLGGQDVCAGLGLAPTAACPNAAICCEPAPNTDVCAALNLTPLCSGLGLTVTFNEQLANPANMSGDPNAITVNAIHVHLGGAIPGTNAVDVIVSNAHCDAGTAGTTEPETPSPQTSPTTSTSGSSLQGPSSTGLGPLSGLLGSLLPSPLGKTSQKGLALPKLALPKLALPGLH